MRLESFFNITACLWIAPLGLLSAVGMSSASAQQQQYTPPPIEARQGGQTKYSRSHNSVGGTLFIRSWYERETPAGRQGVMPRLRVNSPDIVLHHYFGGRSEVRENGLALLTCEQDPRLIQSASLYIDLWGGHPRTSQKTVSINGRSTYAIDEVGTAAGMLTHQYPVIPLEMTDLVNGVNAIQFSCLGENTFWGHFLVNEISIDVVPSEAHPIYLDHPELRDATFELSAHREARFSELIRLECHVPSSIRPLVQRVDFEARYEGFDENGDGVRNDWHGMTKDRLPVGIVGSSSEWPYTVDWDTSMLPVQSGVAVRARVVLDEALGAEFRTEPLEGLAIKREPVIHVEHFEVAEADDSMWARDHQVIERTIRVPVDPRRIERSEMHLVVWDGGCNYGDISGLSLNGVSLDLTVNGKHDTIYHVLEIDPQQLVEGANTVLLECVTEHHGMEILRPGPVLKVRWQ